MTRRRRPTEASRPGGRRGGHGVGRAIGRRHGYGQRRHPDRVGSAVVTLRTRDRPRRRHGAAAVGGRRDGVLLVHDPAPRGRPRLRLAAARHLPADGRRRRSPAAWRSARSRCARPRRSASSSACLRRRSACRSSGAGPGVSGQRAEHDRRTARVAAMTGIDRAGPSTGPTSPPAAAGPEFPPVLDLVPVAIGVVGLVAGGARRRRQPRRVAPAHARRRRLPRRGHRRHAARPLVPRAARAAAAACSTSWSTRSAGCGRSRSSPCCCRPG